MSREAVLSSSRYEVRTNHSSSIRRQKLITLTGEIVLTHKMHEELDKASLALVVEDQDELDHLSDCPS